MRPLRFVAWGIVVALAVLSAATYADLPAQVPVHLGLDGRPDRFADRSFWRWFTLPAGAVVLQLLMELFARLIPARPNLLNIPDKERLLALPPAWRAPVTREAVLMLDATGAGIAAVFLLIQWQFVRIAGGQAGASPVLMAILPIGLTVVLLLFVSRITTALDAAHRAWKAAGSPAE